MLKKHDLIKSDENLFFKLSLSPLNSYKPFNGLANLVNVDPQFGTESSD